MLAEGKRLFAPIGSGAQNGVALDQYSAMAVSENLPRYMLQTYNGNMYHFTSAAITVAATHATPLGAGTATPLVALWNPVGSGKNLVIVKVGAAAWSGTLAAGGLVWNYANFTTLTTASASTPVSGIMGQAASAVAKVYSNVVTTGSAVGIFYKQEANLATTGVLAANGIEGEPAYEDVGGDVLIPPGTWGALAAAAAGTSPIVTCSLSWIEAPI
jgi:hypothetical protein